MADTTRIREHMEVVGSDGAHVGTVDKVEGARIKLTRTDPAAGGDHHYLHLDMVDAVEDDRVRLVRTAAQAKDEWGVEAIGAVPTDDRDEHGSQPGSATAGP